MQICIQTAISIVKFVKIIHIFVIKNLKFLKILYNLWALQKLKNICLTVFFLNTLLGHKSLLADIRSVLINRSVIYSERMQDLEEFTELYSG